MEVRISAVMEELHEQKQVGQYVSPRSLLQDASVLSGSTNSRLEIFKVLFQLNFLKILCFFLGNYCW